MGLIDIPNECPWIMKHINERLGIMLDSNILKLPDFTNAESVFSVSDYAGEDAKKVQGKYVNYQVLSFLILDWNNAGMWDLARKAFRVNKLDFKRTMEYKKLNKDKERLRLLDEFLEMFDNINGIIMTYLIHNDIKYLFSEKSLHSSLEEKGYGTWKPHIAEKLLRVCHLQALMIDKLTNENHKFFWFTDRDSITKDTDNLGKILKDVFNVYATHGFKEFCFAEPFLNDDKHITDDLLSIPDLVAGATLEYFHQLELKEKGLADKINVQDKTNKILVWLANKNSVLKKVTCKISLCDDGKWAFHFLGFNKNESLNC